MSLLRLTAIISIAVAILSLGTASERPDANVLAEEDAGPHLTDEGPVAGPIDDHFAEVAQTVPAFAGMFLDESGNLNVYLLDASKKAEAEAAIANVFGSDRFEGAPVKALQAQFGFLDLYRWRLDMRRAVLGIPGVVSLDIDETRNRVRVGFEDMEAQAAVEVELAKLGVPRDAVIFEEDTPIEEASHTLRSLVRPVRGGLQIKRSGAGACTLGFGAGRSGTGGFVTASHCTSVRGGVDGTVFHQPTVTGSNRIGVEVVDPAFWSGAGCPSGRRCRWSDSAWALWDGGVSHQRRVARPKGLMSTTINHSGDNYRVTSEIAMPAIGETLNKVGRTTGRTKGPVDATCRDLDVAPDITYQCQDRVGPAGAAGGDSGSPVFKITNSPATRDVSLYGVAWAGDWGGAAFWFSSMYLIQLDLGSLNTCASGFNC